MAMKETSKHEVEGIIYLPKEFSLILKGLPAAGKNSSFLVRSNSSISIEDAKDKIYVAAKELEKLVKGRRGAEYNK